MTIIEAHKKYAVEGISLNLLRERIHKGWSAKKSLTFPKHKNQFG